MDISPTISYITFLLIVGDTLCTNNITTTEHDLHKELFDSYNPDIIPILNKSEAIEISLEIYVMNIDNIDEKTQTFTI